MVTASGPLERPLHGRVLARGFVQALAFRVELVANQLTRASPAPDRLPAHVEQGGRLRLGQQTALAKPGEVIREPVVLADAEDAVPVVARRSARPESTSVQDGGDFGFMVMVEQTVDLLDHSGRSLPGLPDLGRHWQGERPSGAAAEADVGDDLLLSEQRDVLQDE